MYNIITMNKRKYDILALGVGNTLLSDEGAGIRVVETLETHPKTSKLGLRLMDGGTMGLSLLVDMEDADALIIIDAANLGAAPGTIEIFAGENMDKFLRHRGRSPHDIGLDDLMDGLRLREALPERRALVGIEPARLTVGETLTETVAAAVPKAADAVIDLAQGWLNEIAVTLSSAEDRSRDTAKPQ